MEVVHKICFNYNEDLITLDPLQSMQTGKTFSSLSSRMVVAGLGSRIRAMSAPSLSTVETVNLTVTLFSN